MTISGKIYDMTGMSSVIENIGVVQAKELKDRNELADWIFNKLGREGSSVVETPSFNGLYYIVQGITQDKFGIITKLIILKVEN